MGLLLQPIAQLTRRSGKNILAEAVENWETMSLQLEFLVRKNDLKGLGEAGDVVGTRLETLQS